MYGAGRLRLIALITFCKPFSDIAFRAQWEGANALGYHGKEKRSPFYMEGKEGGGVRTRMNSYLSHQG
jgi:hypothetical protein